MGWPVAIGLSMCLAPASHAQDARSARIEGTVWDSLHAAPLTGAKVHAVLLGGESQRTIESVTETDGSFRLEGVVPGRYSVSFESALLDSLEFGGPVPQVTVAAGQTAHLALATPSAATLRTIACPGVSFVTRSGALLGQVTDAETDRPLAGAAVIVAWTAFAIDTADGALRSEFRTARALADESGQFHLCGVPTEDALALQVQHGGRAGAVLRVSIGNDVGLAVRNVSFSADTSRAMTAAASAAIRDTLPSPPLRGTSSLVGTVRTASGAPVADASVNVAGTDAVTRTDEHGAFALSGLPAGSHDMEVRRIGYRLLRQTVALRRGTTVRRDMQLERVVLLDSIAVVAQRQAYPDFESHRKFATNGRFITDADFDWHHMTGVSDIVNQTPGFSANVVGQGSNAYMPGCMVVVDNMAEPDVPGVRRPGGQLSNVAPSDVGAMEFYPPGSRSAPAQFHPAQPPRFGLPGDAPGCVIMIWTKSWAAARASKR